MTKRPAGFTLIELMVVVAIIGILSSIAIPNFRNMQLRARMAERATMLRALQTAVDDYYNTNGRYPDDLGSGNSQLYLYWNPTPTPLSTRQKWRYSVYGPWEHWDQLSLAVEGNVYYVYWGFGYASPGFRYHYLYAYGDLDGDGTQDQLERIWEYSGSTLLRWAGSPLDSSASWENHYPVGASVVVF
jgi:prepilin-type N-terminal cleavage/methylation domain-containing protein